MPVCGSRLLHGPDALLNRERNSQKYKSFKAMLGWTEEAPRLLRRHVVCLVKMENVTLPTGI